MGDEACKFQLQPNFKVPPEAPVFEPNAEEFQDPLAYLKKIRPIAEKTGICKIKPPPDWQPPFALDIENFKFSTRIQKLNELEAKTRIKLNFLDQIAKFWELQGAVFKVPSFEKRVLDLYGLHKAVNKEGGAAAVTKERKWSKVATQMGYPNGKTVAALLKTHYERLLYPYDVFKESFSSKFSPDSKVKKEEKKISKVCKQTLTSERKYPRRGGCSSNESSPNKAKEGGPGCFPGARRVRGCMINSSEDRERTKPRRLFMESDPLAKYVCKTCERGDAEESMLLCDGCDDSYHTFCLTPPLQEIPKGDWRCPLCVVNEVEKPKEAYGFEHTVHEYTLHQFGEMADQFKSDYFNMPVHRVPTSVVEKEFWRIVSSIEEDITVEYGADLHTAEHGSGFPTRNSSGEIVGANSAEYVDSQWNLNNIASLDGSVLSFINADISGMKIPWMYVGMCFATFCWHNEDHWSYSINYLHWGESKTWYGVPGRSAEQFETCMKQVAPELFDSQPDLLHQLVTLMNPNVLMAAGIPVFRTDQHAGEFVITFPRAYHSGFNQGYNFAEAVNFAPTDWLMFGRECIKHYSTLHRFCVFSHDELVCKMAANVEGLDASIAGPTYEDMLKMVDAERLARKELLNWGVCEAEREAFELLQDDERQCEVCKTTCFLSAVTCGCSSSRLVCLRHYASLCSCAPKLHTLRYRYTLDEMAAMLIKVKLKSDLFTKLAQDTPKPAIEPPRDKPISV